MLRCFRLLSDGQEKGKTQKLRSRRQKRRLVFFFLFRVVVKAERVPIAHFPPEWAFSATLWYIQRILLSFIVFAAGCVRMKIFCRILNLCLDFMSLN